MGSDISALNRLADSYYNGMSDIEGNKSNFRLKGNQELSKEEMIQRQNKLIDHIKQNDNADE